MASTVQSFLDRLTPRHRVIVIGGLSVIALGYSRHTSDVDIWLDPMTSPEEWANTLEEICGNVLGATIHRLPGWVKASGTEVAAAAFETGVVRILGLDLPLDVFRRPNEFEEEDFEQVIARATLKGDGTYLPDALDLIQTKLDTGRDKDIQDIMFLESVIRADYKKRLPTAGFEESKALLDRYSEWQVLLPALENPSPQVRELALLHLREFAAGGDPFSQAILEGRDLPGTST